MFTLTLRIPYRIYYVCLQYTLAFLGQYEELKYKRTCESVIGLQMVY
jgi:hypothetical protein